jgi:YD repeat-containing protein
VVNGDEHPNTSLTYDSLDRLKQVTYADTSTVTHTYDAGDRLTQMWIPRQARSPTPTTIWTG